MYPIYYQKFLVFNSVTLEFSSRECSSECSSVFCFWDALTYYYQSLKIKKYPQDLKKKTLTKFESGKPPRLVEKNPT